MRLHWSPQARSDLDRAWFFHADHSLSYADRVESRIMDRADALMRFPKLGRLDPLIGARMLSIPDIQYLIVYRVDDDTVRILRIWSTAQDRQEDMN